MKIKKTIVILLAAALLIGFCACGAQKTVLLYTLYQSEKLIKAQNILPDSVDFGVSKENFSSKMNGIGDSEIIEKLIISFMKIKAGEETQPEKFETLYFADFNWNDETASVCMSDSIAEITKNDGVHYYEISDNEEFISLLSSEAKQNNEASFNCDTVIDENNLTVEVMKDGSFDENGNYLVDIYVINNNQSAVGVVLSDIKVNGKNCGKSGILTVPGKNELGFSVPVETKDIETVKTVSFHIEAGYGADEEFSAFTVSDEYKVKLK